MFLKFFPSQLKIFDPLHQTQRVDNNLVISDTLDWSQCLKLRADIISFNKELSTVKCVNVDHARMGSYLRYLQQRNILVAILFEDTLHNISRKQTKESTAQLVGKFQLIQRLVKVFLEPLQTRLCISRCAFNLVRCRLKLNTLKSWEKLLAVNIRVFPDCIQVEGFLQTDIDAGVSKLCRFLGADVLSVRKDFSTKGELDICNCEMNTWMCLLSI